jgi:NADH-quinone oxidoreductase subunit L
MGGLRDKMPSTYRTFVIGAAALAGIPPFSGFFSKDAILLAELDSAPVLYVIGLVTALLTAFYSFRAVFVAFHGTPRDQHLYDHAHESPPLMTVPLWILAVLSIMAGVINLPFVLTLEKWLEPAIGVHEEPLLTLELLAITLSIVVAIFGAVMAWARYRTDEQWPQRLAGAFSGLEPALQHKWYLDEFYWTYIVVPLRRLSGWFATTIDQRVIDGAVNGVANLSFRLGERTRRIETGAIPTYALSILIGVVALVAFFIFSA